MQYVFIVGTGRSGTNLAQDILSMNNQLIQVGETHFLYTLAHYTKPLNAVDYLEIAYNHFDSQGEKRWIAQHIMKSGLTYNEFFERFVEECRNRKVKTIKGYTDVFYYLCYGRENLIIVDKTPTYGLVVQKLAELFPGSKFIHLIRDGRIAATSMQKHRGFIKLINAGFPDNVEHYSYDNIQKDFPENKVSLIDCAKFWNNLITKINKQLQGISAERQLTIRYETIIIEPDNAVGELIRFLNLKSDFLHSFTMKHIARPDSLEKSYNRLSKEQFSQLSNELNTTLQQLGYEIEYGLLIQNLKPSKLFLRKVEHLIAFSLFVFFKYTKL